MATNPYKKVMPQLGQVVQNYDPNASVEKPAVLPIYNQQPVAEPGNTSASAIAMRNMFRVDPTPNQAMAVGASPVSETERAAEINQLKVDAARREAAKEPVFQTQQKKINPESSTDGMEALLYTSPQREDELRKASVQRQRIMAIGDALRHIGNIYNTVNYAPAQQFNSPVDDERQRYLKEKAVRDNNNYRYLTYQQAKRAQEQKMKQWEQQFRYNLAKDAANFELKKNESEARQQRQRALAALDEARLKGQLDKNTYQRLVNEYYPEQAQARISEIESRIAKNNRTGGGRGGRSGGKYYAYDEDGNIHYFDNATMWKQAVESYSTGQPQTEEHTSVDKDGNKRTTQVNRSTAKKGGQNMRNAQRGRSAVSQFSINGNQGKGGSNVSRFSIKGNK